MRAIPWCGAGLLVLFSVLYFTGNPLYYDSLTLLMNNPFPHPFIDWEWIPSAVECWRQHIDVYADNTCYAPFAHGRHIYSPLWLRMTFLPYGPAWVAPFGLGFAALFFASLAMLPPQPGIAAICVTFLATFSSLTAYAIERGNIDLIIFLLVIAGTRCWFGALRWRLLGYAIFLLAGLLKFYPLVLLALALRERPRAFAAVAAASVVALSVFVLAFRDELGRVDRNLLSGAFVGSFGAVNLPYGGLLGAGIVVPGPADPRQWMRYLPQAWLLGLALTAIIRAVRLARRFRLDVALAAMPKPEAGFLISGSMLICACFFAGQNNGYRAVIILLTLPGLLWLGRSTPDRAGRVTFMATAWAIVFIMWALSIQQVIGRFGIGNAVYFDHFLLNEVAWWWVVSVLLAVLLCFVRGSWVGRLGYRWSVGPSRSKKLPCRSTAWPAGAGR